MPGDDHIRTLGRLMDVAVLRARVHAGNLANQDTPGYKAKAVAFEDAFRAALDAGDQNAAAGIAPEVYEPRATASDNDGNDVSGEREVMALAQNQMLYNAYVGMMRGQQRLLMTAITPAPGG
jgi:flagellar basal-body rod protein FlgB